MLNIIWPLFILRQSLIERVNLSNRSMTPLYSIDAFLTLICNLSLLWIEMLTMVSGFVKATHTHTHKQENSLIDSMLSHLTSIWVFFSLFIRSGLYWFWRRLMRMTEIPNGSVLMANKMTDIKSSCLRTHPSLCHDK